MERGHRSRTPRIDLYWMTNTIGHWRVGVIVPRHGATAVSRNRLRRRLREIARRGVLPRVVRPVDVVIRARQAAYRAPVVTLASDLDAWQQSLSG